MDSAERAKDEAERRVTSAGEQLVSLSHRIHGRPELAFEEHAASAWVGEALADAGFDVEPGTAGLATALRATAGSGPLRIAICAEYDALPQVGHACGHNVIAAAAVGAGLALGGLADELGLTVLVLGTPAEESGGGKVLMLERGAFDGVHAAMMIHPASYESPRMDTLAVSHFRVRYSGREAHASMHPEQGINAADAMVVSQVAIGLLRQHLHDGDQVHGIVTHGGDAPNVVPAATEAQYLARARTLADLDTLMPRIEACFEAGAVATGAGMSIEPISPRYSEFREHQGLAESYVRNATALGRSFPDRSGARPGGSTDMANVSLALPAIHPMMDIDSLPAVNHQPAFTRAAAAPAADRALLDGAVAMAWTAIDAATDAALGEELRRLAARRAAQAV